MDVTTKATGEIQTIALNPFQRALGRMITIDIHADKDPGQANRDLAGDVFWNLYQSNPEFIDPVPEERKLNRGLVDYMSQSPTWESNHQATSGSMFESALTAGFMYQHLTQDDTIKKILDKQREAEEARKQAEAQQAAADALRQAGNDQKANDAQKGADQSKAKADGLSQAAQKQLDKLTQSPKGEAIRAAINQASKDDTEKTTAMMTGWGMEPDAVTPSNMEEITRQLKEIQQQGNAIEEITKLMGRVKGIAVSVRKSKIIPSGTILEGGSTRNLLNIFSSEKALLRPDVNPLVRAQAVGDYADHGLLGMIEGQSEIKEGDLVIAVDESGSMDGPRYIRAKAIALGIAQAAAENDQEYHIFSFSSGVGGEVKSSQSWMEHIGWAAHRLNGGTNFSKALDRAADIIEALKVPERADILFITDGEAGVDDKVKRRIQELKEAFGTRLVVLAVEVNHQYTDLPNLSTKVIDISDNSNLDSVAGELADALIRTE